jgi:hypothetical protein
MLRARRFPTQLPLHYRGGGEIGWYKATTENISRTGVLFKGEQLLRANTPVEMRFEMVCLPPLEPACVAEVLWRGNIVRTTLPTLKATSPALAATISQYLLLPGKKALEV